jgi:hypothetical protein
VHLPPISANFPLFKADPAHQASMGQTPHADQ